MSHIDCKPLSMKSIMKLFIEEASANFVPAAAVIRRRQVLFGMIGRKGFVGGLNSLIWKRLQKSWKIRNVKTKRTEDESRISGGAIKCVEIRRKTKGEGSSRGWVWHWKTKAWGSTGIRDPVSPRRKRWGTFWNPWKEHGAEQKKLTRSLRLGSTAARLKRKGIDGSLHKQWSMWFNSTKRAEPYLVLTFLESLEKKLMNIVAIL